VSSFELRWQLQFNPDPHSARAGHADLRRSQRPDRAKPVNRQINAQEIQKTMDAKTLWTWCTVLLLVAFLGHMLERLQVHWAFFLRWLLSPLLFDVCERGWEIWFGHDTLSVGARSVGAHFWLVPALNLVIDVSWIVIDTRRARSFGVSVFEYWHAKATTGSPTFGRGPDR
jgi:hypothetical protein